MTRRFARRRVLGIAPLAWIAILLYVAFLLYPLVKGALISLTDENPLNAHSSFVGFANYAELVTDTQLLASLQFTIVVVVAVTIGANTLGLLFALLLNKGTALFRILRTLIFIPQVLSGVIVAFIWRSILTQDGLLNVVLLDLHIIQQPVSWLGTPQLATMSVSVVVIWITTGFAAVVYSASLQSVPTELYEAARVDGASAFARFRHVTWPMIAPGVTITVVLCFITTFKLYDVIAVLTGGGPADSTRSTAFYVVQQAFTSNRFGYSSAIAIVLFILTAVVAYVATALLRRREERI
ncbi:carbohydrate ABC transporter permease [Diaminobutyricibacter sp. McL0618]|uniref:carbohydrate ABC transporter permease n=1 Tax=Leifsonia sp. McL0618 TaxID=3415677 RepID=UPI003CF784F8